MSKSRKESYSKEDKALAALCKALSHPARVSIVQILAERGECVCGDLVSDLPLAQSTVSQHLVALKRAGLIQGEIDGPSVRYCLRVQNLETLQKTLGRFTHKISGRARTRKC